MVSPCKEAVPDRRATLGAGYLFAALIGYADTGKSTYLRRWALRNADPSATNNREAARTGRATRGNRKRVAGGYADSLEACLARWARRRAGARIAAQTSRARGRRTARHGWRRREWRGGLTASYAAGDDVAELTKGADGRKPRRDAAKGARSAASPPPPFGLGWVSKPEDAQGAGQESRAGVL